MRNYSDFKISILSVLIGAVLGVYEGLIGPGTGTFLIQAFSSILGYDLFISSGCAKISNLASNLGSVLVYFLSGKVVFALAVPAAFCGIIGGYFGARYAVKGGIKRIYC